MLKKTEQVSNFPKSSIYPGEKLVDFSCVSCDSTYRSYSTLKSGSKISIGSCANCHHIYTGQSVSEIKTGKVEKFRRRQQKTERILENREKPKN